MKLFRHSVTAIAAVPTVWCAFAALGASTLTGSAVAADSADPCAGAMVQSDLNSCTDAEYRKADQQLSALYAKFKPTPPKLRLAERAWIAYRDAECDFAGDYAEGGSMQPMVISGCLTELTNQRIETLKRDLADLNP